MLWPGNCFDHNGSDWICRICVDIANYDKGAAGTLRKNARYYHTIARCATGLLTKSTKVKTQATTRAKMISNQGMYDEFMSVMRNSRSVWEKGEGSNLLTETRAPPISLSARTCEAKRRNRPIPRKTFGKRIQGHHLFW